MIDIQLEVLWDDNIMISLGGYYYYSRIDSEGRRILENSPLGNSPVNSPHCCLRWPNWLELWWEILPHNKPRNTYYSNSILCEDGNSEGLTEILPKIIRNYPQNSPPRPISRLWADPSVIRDHTHAWIMIGMGYWHRNLHSDRFI